MDERARLAELMNEMRAQWCDDETRGLELVKVLWPDISNTALLASIIPRLLAHIDAQVAAARAGAIGAGAADILVERRRQISEERWSAEHDDAHTTGELSLAAGCYAIGSSLQGERDRVFTRYWPWHKRWWKPGDRRRMLVKAGALILAEIERLDRAALPLDAPPANVKDTVRDL